MEQDREQTKLKAPPWNDRLSLGDMPAFVARTERELKAAFPEVDTLFYGHAGDGNLHAIVSVGRMDATRSRRAEA